MAILISPSFQHITTFGVFITLQLNDHGCVCALISETTPSYSSTKALKMVYIIQMMSNTSMFFFYTNATRYEVDSDMPVQ